VPEAFLWIAGDGPLRRKLEQLAEELGVARRVRFLGWRTDRAALLRAADICVFPSRYEPFGTVMVEAWATGIPLVAAASAGPRAYVRDGENGLLVPIDDAKALATAIARCIADADLRQRLIAGGSAIYAAEFTEASFVAAITALYREMLAQAPARSAA
jgi:glycosyltransferase involved in cell wall biosynthesis